MKKIILIVAALFSTFVYADRGRNNHNPHYNFSQPQHHNHHSHRTHSYNWVFPTIVGGAIIYGVTRPQPPIIVEQPIYAPVQRYEERWVWDEWCNCWKRQVVLVTY